MPRKSRLRSSRGTVWQCPRCNQRVILFVRIEIPPTCSNRAVHSQSTINMEELQK
jgi:DNA-directed RNA polymerase subunit RPC12/RpoP